ncbi:hypothetical protein ACFQAT_02845 [Undibacterium arcticum]|uniref:Lipoprotein SmpA/OmlA domain-containing protein n=1 Tax=Undibacterium arcticum TaxID=1762892 RepID=A0ABV7F2F9_9BURK
MNKNIVLAAAILAIAGCANTKAPDHTATAVAPATQTQTQAAAQSPTTSKANQDKPIGEILGSPAANSRFARLKLGMAMSEVSALIGAPDDLSRYETGKRWIPFYLGNDAQRLEVLYKNEGCLTYSGGNVFGGGSNELIRIAVDLKGACFKQG